MIATGTNQTRTEFGMRRRSLRRSEIALGLLTLALSSRAWAFTPQAGNVSFRFTNKESQKACGLYFQLSELLNWPPAGVPANWQTPDDVFLNSSDNASTRTYHLFVSDDCSTEGVPVDGTLRVDFTWPGSKMPVIQRWWWTKLDGTTVGLVKLPVVRRTKWGLAAAAGSVAVGGIATGDGVVNVDACGETTLEFHTANGETAAQTATRMAAEIDAHFILDVPVFVEDDAVTVTFAGGCFGDETEDPETVLASPDSSLPAVITTALACGTDCPAVSEWGLIVMTLLVLAAGTVVARRHSAPKTEPYA